MNKIIRYISSFWKESEANEDKNDVIYELEYKWIASFIQELGFSNISHFNYGLNQDFIHQQKEQKILLSIELSPRKRAWDVISIQLISNKKDTIKLVKKWSIWNSSLHNENLKKEIRNVSDAFFSVDVSFGDKEPLLLYGGLKLEDIYIVPPHASFVYSKNLEDLVIKAFNLGCLKLSNIRPLKSECRLWGTDGIERFEWKEDGYVGSAHKE